MTSSREHKNGTPFTSVNIRDTVFRLSSTLNVQSNVRESGDNVSHQLKSEGNDPLLKPILEHQEQEAYVRELQAAMSLKEFRLSDFYHGHKSTPSDASTGTNNTNTTDTSTQPSIWEYSVSPRKSSLAKVGVAPLHIQKLKTPRSESSFESELPADTKSIPPFTPPSEFAPIDLVIQKTRADSLGGFQTPEIQSPASCSDELDKLDRHCKDTVLVNKHKLSQGDTPTKSPSFESESQTRQQKRHRKTHQSSHSEGSVARYTESAQSDRSEPRTAVSITLSDFVSPKAYERMKLRHNIARELYYTERQFAQDMAVVVRIYMCGSADLGLSMRQIDALFSNVTHVMDLSLSIVAILETQIPPQILHNDGTMNALDIAADSELRIGKAMCLALNGQFYEVCETYIHCSRKQMELCYQLTQIFKSNCDTADLKQCPETNGTSTATKRSSREKPSSDSSNIPMNLDKTKLADWLVRSKLRAEKFTTGWSLDSLLIKPTQRLAKYPLFLKSMLQCTDVGHCDYDDLQKAYKRSVQYLDCINTRYEASQ